MWKDAASSHLREGGTLFTNGRKIDNKSIQDEIHKMKHTKYCMIEYIPGNNRHEKKH